MPLLRKGVLLPVEGVDFSKPATFISDRAGFSQNMRYDRALMRKRPGKTLLGSQVSDATQIMGLGKLELNSQVKYVVRASKAKLQRYNTSSEDWEDISATAFTGGDEDFFSFATVTESGLLIITNGYDRIRKWDGGGNAALLGGSPPFAKYCTYLSPYLLLAYTDDGVDPNPWNVQWCDTDNPENWTTGNSGATLLSYEPSPIQNIANLNEFVAGYKKESLWLGRKVDPPDIFVFEPIKTGVGLGAPRAFADAEGTHYFMGLNDFFAWNGPRVESIGSAVREEVFSRINRQKIKRCFANHIQELNEVWFYVVIAGYDWPTEIWKYNYRNSFWYFDTCSELTSAIRWERTNTLSWADATGTWDEAQTAWDAGVTVASWEDIVFGDADGYTHVLDYTTTNDNGVAVSSYFITKDFIGETMEFAERWLRFDVWAKGPGKLWVDYSTDFGSNWTSIPYTSSQSYADLDSVMRKHEWYMDVWAEQIAFRLRNDQTGETMYLQSMYPYYLNREEVAAYR